jgi:CheY-like chemotaxis protein
VGAERATGGVHVVVSDPGPELTRLAEGELFGRSLRNRRSRGIGLYLCQQLAAASGGRLFRERTRGGARFVLALPEEAPPPPCGEPGHAVVLVGDPDPVRRGRTVAALRLDGHEAAGVGDGVALIRSLDERAFDVVVTDLLMPGAGGVAGLSRIRAQPAAPAVIVIAPSAERPEALDGAERAGALAVLATPVDWPHLLSLVGCAAASRAG